VPAVSRSTAVRTARASERDRLRAELGRSQRPHRMAAPGPQADRRRHPISLQSGRPRHQTSDPSTDWHPSRPSL